ncbi:TPA: hypothetical protein P7C33_004232 [Escherichia coli]|nr:hypothetical protein [Escherichia coli]HDP8187824.1 hypothetical protein [Escherichia coli]
MRGKKRIGLLFLLIAVVVGGGGLLLAQKALQNVGYSILPFLPLDE